MKADTAECNRSGHRGGTKMCVYFYKHDYLDIQPDVSRNLANCKQTDWRTNKQINNNKTSTTMSSFIYK